jgi:putative metallohydrolase (TIGR04338 family)
VSSRHDPQAQRLYEAEDRLPERRDLMRTVAECQAFIDQVTGTRWWHSRFPDVTHVRVRYARSGAAIAYCREHEIIVPPSMRSPLVLLHELAHIVAPTHHHDSAFAWIYCELVKRELGGDVSRRLRLELRRAGVEVGPAAWPDVSSYAA